MNSNVSRRRNLDTNSGPYSRLKCLRPLLAAPFLAGLLLASSLPTTAQVTIDSFTTNQATITDPPGGASTAVTGGADILGGKRGLKVRNLAGPGPTTAGVSGGFLEIGVTATTPDSQGEVDLFWDGDSDNNPATFDPTGLGAVDLTAGGTQGGFLLLVDSAQAGSHLILSVWEDADRVSRVGRVLPAIAAPTPIFLGFSELTASPGAVAPADLTQVGAITLRLGATESASPPVLRIDSLTTAAPSLAAAKVDTLAGVPVTGPVNPGTTLRYRVTIANEGAGAQGVGFEDLVTDLNLGAPSGVRTTALARRDQYSTVTGVPVDTAVDGLLANDSDADGDALTATAATGQATEQGGSVDIDGDGDFLYTPPAGFVGVDAFTYTLVTSPGDPTTDAAGASIGPRGSTAFVIVDRVPPVITAGGTLVYTENDPPSAIDPALTVTDTDSPNLSGATVEISANYVPGEDVLAFVNTASLTGVWVPATGTLTLSGTDTVAAYQAALRSVTYETTSEAPATANRTVTWTATDGSETSAPATSTVQVISVNDPPVVTTSGGASTFTEDGGPVAVDIALTVVDADDTNLTAASVTLANPQDGAAETLAAGACPGLTVTPGPASLAITGVASVASYQSCLRSVTYDNSDQDPTALPSRIVAFAASDAQATGLAAQKTVVVVPVNDPPVAGDDSWDTVGNTQLVVDLPALARPHVRDTTPSTFGVLDNDSDPVEGDAVAVSAVVGCADLTPPFGDSPACSTTNGGRVVLNATGSFTYTPAVGDSATTDSFQYVLTDDGAPLPASDTATVTIHRFERVWYVDNSSAAGGLGRSNDPFDTLLEAQTASSANDWIFVHFGNGTTTGQAGGITLKAGQRLIGEHVGLTLPVSLNGGGPSSTLFPAVPGNRPLLDDTVAGAPEGVAATDAIPAEIAGLSLAGNVNGIDLTTNAAFAGSGTLAIHDNVVRSSGAEGIDVQHAGSGALRLEIHDNSVTAGTHGIDLLRSGGSLTVQRFDGNVIGGNTGSSGIVVSGVVFDATPGLPINTVDGGATVIGQSGDGVGTHGLFLTNVTGDLAFTDLDVWNDGGTGLLVSSTGALNAGAGTGFRVTVPAGVATVDANGGPAVDVNNASVTLPLGFLESTNSPTTGLSLVNAFGGAGLTALSASAGQISDPVGASGTAVFVSGGTGNVSLGIPVTNTAGNSVAVTGRSADTVSFTSAVSDTGSGVSLTSNTGGTISFRGGLSASTGANPAFAATGGGLVEVCDENPCSAGATGPLVNSLTTTTGVALNVANTTITANELEFRSISAGTAGSGPANGVVLNNTGALGALRVKGTGSAGSGGTLQKTTGDGISLVATRPPSFSFVNVSNTGSHGIEVNGVAGLTLTGCQITNAGDGDNEHGLRLLNTSGTVAINSTTFNNAAEDLINVDNTNTNLTLNVGSSSQLSFPATLGTFAGNGILMVGRGSSALTVNVSGNTISNVKLAALQVGGDGTSTGTHNITVANNTMTVGIAGRSNNVNVQARNTSTVTLSITGNAMNGVGGGPINIGADDSSQVNATVSGNNMIANSPSAGILAANDNGSRLRILISGNQITNVGGDGIEIANFGGVGVSELDAIVTNNTVNGHSTNPASFFLGGIVIFGFEDSTCVVLTGNNVQGTPSPGTFFDYSLEELGGTMILEEVPNTAATTANAAYVLSTNTGGSSTVDIVGTIDLSNGATVCDRP